MLKTAAAGNEELIFPYREYLQYWEKEIEKRLCGLNSRSAFEARVEPDPRDCLLLDELRRSVEVMPLDLDAVKRIIASLKEITGEHPDEHVKTRVISRSLIRYLSFQPLSMRSLTRTHERACLHFVLPIASNKADFFL